LKVLEIQKEYEMEGSIKKEKKETRIKDWL
jgi:hypothetical protein